MAKQLNSIGTILCLLVLIGATFSTTMMRPPQRRNEFMSTEDAVRFLKQLDDYYSVMSRPRFGKRASVLQYMKDWALEQGEMEDNQNKYQMQA